MLVTVVDTLSLLIFAGLPECRFSVPAPESHRSVASLRRHKLCFAHFRAMHEKFAHAVAPPLPKKSDDFSGAPTVLAKSYPIQPVIQL